MEIKSGNSGLSTQLGVYKKQVDQVDGARPTPLRKSDGKSSAGRGDTVSLSDDAFLLNEARGAASSSTDIRQDKVEAIKAKLANGTYQMNTQKIARGILSDEQGLE